MTRLLDLGLAVATIASAALLVLLLGAPLLEPTATGRASATPSSVPTPAATSAADLPVGRYLLRGALTFGPCLGLELAADSFPAGDDAAPGEAIGWWWQRGMRGCETRTGHIREIPVAVTPIFDEEAEPPGEPIGYELTMRLPRDPSAETTGEVGIILLTRRSGGDVLQGFEADGPGSGLVFDRVPVVEPASDPLPDG